MSPNIVWSPAPVFEEHPSTGRTELLAQRQVLQTSIARSDGANICNATRKEYAVVCPFVMTHCNHQPQPGVLAWQRVDMLHMSSVRHKG